MTDQQINIAIAEHLGWEEVTRQEKSASSWVTPSGRHYFRNQLPFCNDLNAMHAAEGTLTPEQRYAYSNNVWMMVRSCAPPEYGNWSFIHLHATARHRAEAFLRTVGKWEDVE